jgi:hypothetical protein
MEHFGTLRNPVNSSFSQDFIPKRRPAHWLLYAWSEVTTMKTKILTGLLFLVVGCSGGQTTGGEDGGQQSVNELKKAAAEAKANGADEGDVCGSSGWYGDGQCDSFCQDQDSVDCVSDPGGVSCALFLEQPNGFCSRLPNDPCIGQDPDCGPGSIEPVDPNEPVACLAIALAPDGVCDPDWNDPCAFNQDPDCHSGGGSPPNPGTPTDPAEPSEPVACAEYIELPDDVCKRDPTDPCIFQDPDCKVE